MQEIRVVYDFNAAPEEVFAGISDHVAFLTATHIYCCLLRPGTTERNGLGALREVHSGLFRFQEEITVFDAPQLLEYRVRSFHGPFNSRFPFQHELGRIQLKVIGRQTQVVWITRFHFSLPLFGAWLDRKLIRTMGETFLFFLKQLDARLNDRLSSTRPDPL